MHADEAHEFMTPLIDVSLYDPEGKLLCAIRRAFMSKSLLGRPALRLFLKQRVEISATDFPGQTEHEYDIDKVIIWENSRLDDHLGRRAATLPRAG